MNLWDEELGLDEGSNCVAPAYAALAAEVERLGRTCDGRAIDQLRRILSLDFPEELIDVFQRTKEDDRRIRVKAAETLSRTGSEPCIEVLHNAVSGMDAELRNVAAEALVDARAPVALKACLRAFSLDLEISLSKIPSYIARMCIRGDDTLRELTAMLSAEGYNRCALIMLAAILTNHDLCREQWSNVVDQSSADVDTGRVFQEWVEGLTAADWESLKQTHSSGRKLTKIGTAYVLAYGGHERVLDTLIDTLFDETLGDMTVIRQAAAMALGRLGVTRARDALSETFAKLKLADMAGEGHLSDYELEHLGICLTAAVALARHGDQRAYEPLVLLFETFHFIDAGEALGVLGDSRAISILKNGIDEIRMPRVQGNIALASLGESSVLPTLIEFYNSGFEDEAMVEAIGKIGDIRAVEAFQARLSRERLTTKEQENLRLALESIGTPKLNVRFQAEERLVRGLVHEGTMAVENTGADASDIMIRAVGEQMQLAVKVAALPSVLARGKNVAVPIRVRFTGTGEVSFELEIGFTDLLQRRRSVTFPQQFTVQYPNVFISYLHENEPAVSKLIESLKSQTGCVSLWHDKSNLLPGDRWRIEIQDAIQSAEFFISCFSSEYEKRDDTFMSTEIAIAFSEMNQRSVEHNWFIPVKLSECRVPTVSTGGQATLEEMHIVELFKDWDKGIERIVDAIQNEREVPGF